MKRGVPLFSPEGRRVVEAGPAWREHPAYYRDEPPEDTEEQQREAFFMSLPEVARGSTFVAPRKQLERKSQLERVSSLKPTTGGKGKRSKGQREAASEWRRAVLDGPCVMCLVPFPAHAYAAYAHDLLRLDAHHPIPKGTLIREGHAAHVNDPRNGVGVCRYHHSRHHAYVERIPRSLLPAAVFEFAAELGLEAILDREYPATVRRVTNEREAA